MECDQADDTGRSQFNYAVKSQITAMQDAKSRRGGRGGTRTTYLEYRSRSGVDRCEGRRRETAGVCCWSSNAAFVTSMCLSYTGNARFPSCWERERNTGIRGPRSKGEIRIIQRGTSKKVASEARLWPVGRLIGVCRLTCLCLYRSAGGAASQPRGMGGRVSQAGIGLKTSVRWLIQVQ